MSPRRFDVILFGATGFTGNQAARYFAKSVTPGTLNWALAGRSPDKLQQVKSGLGPGFQTLETIVADSADQASVREMVSRTRVVLNTAGPFALYGEPVVSACIRLGVDYVDITGETAYVRRLIDAYHEKARERSVKIIPFCGFDSVPADIGTLLVADHLRKFLDRPCSQVTGFYSARGGVNGGTLASFFQIFETNSFHESRDPFLLNPAGSRPSHPPADSADPSLPHYDRETKRWAAPFFMSPVNTRVVRRSHGLLSEWGEGYGPDFRYQEYLKVGGPLPRAMALGVSAALAATTTLCRHPVTRRILERCSPPPGSGPTEAAMDAGFFRLHLRGKSKDGTTVHATIQDSGDPGNRATVKMLCESALCLALQRSDLPGGEGRGGILTPATGLGHILADRLIRAGMHIDVGQSIKNGS
jgi:short subunit dehydrogenase-like uncharacterized protein